MKPQEKPRVVSKSRYLRYLGRKASLFGSGLFLVIGEAIGALFCLCLLLTGLYVAGLATAGYGYLTGLLAFLGFLTLFIVFGSLCVSVGRSGVRQLEKAEHLEPVVPLTRQSAEQLPAEESLVRASSEPSDVQPEVLLRAAGSDLQTPPEELLRATTHGLSE